MPKRLHKRREADADLDSIWRFIAFENESAANRVLDRIGDVFMLLISNPLAGRDRSDLKSGLRSFVAGRYVVFYCPRPDGVEIVRILHGRQDVTSSDVA